MKLQDGRRYIVSDWQWRLCMSWSAPQVPPPERRQVQLGLYMAAALKGRQPLGRPLLESWNRAWYSGLLNNSVTTRTLKADDLKSWAPFSNGKLVRLASLKDVEVSNFFHWKTAAGLPLKQQMWIEVWLPLFRRLMALARSFKAESWFHSFLKSRQTKQLQNSFNST